MVIRVYKVKYILVAELSTGEEADDLCDFIEEHFYIDQQPSHYYIPEDFKEDLEPEDMEKHKAVIELLEKLEGEEITL